jgi:hypothetical protein
MRANNAVISTVLAGLFLSAGASRAESSVVWQIGKFDEAAREFNGAAPARDPVFVVGKSDPARDWYADQLATSDSAAAPRGRPATIQFELPQAPAGRYTFRLSLLTYTPRLPLLEVRVNGRRGRFYLHPVLNYGGGHPAGRFLPIYARAEVAFDVPSRLLQQGTNEFILAVIDDPPGGNSRITYDALALEHDPAGADSAAALSAEVVPTIFYQRNAQGLVELVDVFVRYHEPPGRGQVTLALGANRLTRELAAGTDFGEQRIRFEAPEFASPTAAEVTVAVNGRTRRFPVELRAAKKWNLFVVPHQHLDIGYTDYPPRVAEVQCRAVDEAIDMMREHPDFRYTLDAGWVAEQFLAGRSQAQRKEFLERIRTKRILLPANYAAIHTGVANVEHLLRSFYPSYKLSRENGGDFDHAILTDLPSHSWSYPSAMAAAGLKYLVLACNNDLGPMLILGRLHENSPFWWEGPDGQRVLTWYSRHYHQVASLFGLPPRLEAGADSLPIFLQMYARPAYRSDGALIFGSQVENTDLYREQAALAGDWNREYAYPRLKFSGVAEALQYIAGQMGDSIPVLRGDGGPYWDIFTAGPAAVLSRETDHRALAAEKFSTISSLVNPRLWPDRPALDQLWKGLLTFVEHHGSGGRSGTLRARHDKDLLAIYNARLAEQVLARSMSALADSIQVPSGTLIVFNPLNWPRSRLVEFNLGRNQELADRATGQAVPFEELAPAPGRGGPSRRVRFLAADVPAVGYKCYTLRPAKAGPAAPAAGAGDTMENAYYRLVLDPSSGAVRSLFDKELNRELVDRAGPYRFNQYLIATGEQDPLSTSGLNPAIVPPPKLEVQGAGSGRLVSITRTPFGMVARLEASAPQTPRLATEIILFDGRKRIEIANRIEPRRGPGGQWRYFAFPLAMDRPEFRYEIQNGVVNPARDALPGAGREWFPVQHWVALDQGDVTVAIVPVDAHLVTFGDIIRYRWPREFGTRPAALFSYQGRGSDQEYVSRYVVTSGRKMTTAELSRLGWDAMSPFELNEVIAQDKVGNPPRPLDQPQASFLDLDHPGVVLATWKQAEDEKGTILRLVETNGQSGAVNVRIPILNVERAWMANGVEENRRPLAVTPRGFTVEVKPFEIVTVRLEGAPRWK